MKKVMPFALFALLLAGVSVPAQEQEPQEFELRLGIGRKPVDCSRPRR